MKAGGAGVPARRLSLHVLLEGRAWPLYQKRFATVC
jgi:hypothetical protein